MNETNIHCLWAAIFRGCRFDREIFEHVICSTDKCDRWTVSLLEDFPTKPPSYQYLTILTWVHHQSSLTGTNARQPRRKLRVHFFWTSCARRKMYEMYIVTLLHVLQPALSFNNWIGNRGLLWQGGRRQRLRNPTPTCFSYFFFVGKLFT